MTDLERAVLALVAAWREQDRAVNMQSHRDASVKVREARRDLEWYAGIHTETEQRA